MTTRAVIYARQSLDRSGEGAAVDRQVADCRRLIEARGWEVAHVLSDNDMSASTGKRRPNYERLLDLMASRQVEAVVCWHIDRLTRRLVDLEQVIGICEATGVRLATVTGDLDLSTDTGRMLARILASVARGEVERKGARQRAANAQRRGRGEQRWGVRPFGYDRRDGAVVVVAEEADALRQAAEMVLGGSALAAACRELAAAGHVTTFGLPWNATTLRRALLNPRYSGRVTYDGVDVGEGTWPVILDGDMQDALAEMLRDSKRRQQSGTKAKHLLSGLARCGRCDSVFYATKGARWLVYKCSSCRLARHADLVDGVVTDVILARLSQPDAADLLAPATDLDALRSERVECLRRRDDLTDLLADGFLSREKVAETAGRLTRRITELEGRIAAAVGDSPVVELVEAADVAAAWAGMDVRSRKAAIDTLVTVTILPAGRGARFREEQVRIDWKT